MTSIPHRSWIRISVVLGLAVTLSACAGGTARVNQFGEFAQAGIKFADAVSPVLDEAFLASVKTDSHMLLEAREGLGTQNARRSALKMSNENLTTRYVILEELKTHVVLLREYFVALDALSQTSAESSGMTEVAGRVADALKATSSTIEGATIGDLPISDFVAPAVKLSFSSYQSAVLNRELQKNAPTIEREIALQEAALTAIAEAMKADLGTLYAAEDRDQIELPFILEDPLPSDWTDKRLEAFQRKVELEKVGDARKAARSLRVSFVALVENRLSDAGMMTLLEDIELMVTMIEGIRGAE